MVLVVRSMWIVALQAIADGGAVDTSLDIIGIFITMALDAKFDRGNRPELYAGNIIVCTDFVATQAAGRESRMHGFSLRFSLVTLQTLAPIDVLLKLNRMLRCHRERENGGNRQK